MAYYIILRGPLGCGKSTIAKRISAVLRAHCFAIDRILDEHGLTKDTEKGYISLKSFLQANKIVVPKAKKFLDKRIPVIFEGNFYWKSQIEDLIRQLEYPYYVFTLKAPVEVCIERDAHRNKNHGEDAARVVYKKSTEFAYGTVIDADKPLLECVKEIILRLPKLKV